MSYNVGQYYEFTREQDGSVRMDCKWKDTDGNTQSVRETVLPEVWAAIVADVSACGSTQSAISSALDLHRQDPSDEKAAVETKRQAIDAFILQRS